MTTLIRGPIVASAKSSVRAVRSRPAPTARAVTGMVPRRRNLSATPWAPVPATHAAPRARIAAAAAQAALPESFVARYQQQCLDNVRVASARLQAIEGFAGEKSVDCVLPRVDRLSQSIEHSLNRAILYRNVHPEEAVRNVAAAHEKALMNVIIGMSSRAMYDQLAALYDHPRIWQAPADTHRVLARLMQQLTRVGVHLGEDTRAQVNALRAQLLTLGQQFEKNIVGDTRHVALPPQALAGLPADFIKNHPVQADGCVHISTDYPDYLPFMQYAEDDSARQRLYTVFRQRGFPANEPVLHELLQKRHAMARLLGFAHWADYVTDDKMIRNGAAAQQFIDRVSTLARPRMARDYAELLKQLQTRDPQAGAVGDWQKGHLAEAVKQRMYAFDARAVRSYLPFAQVREGLFELTGQMFGIGYEKASVPTWHPDVTPYHMTDADGSRLGTFYLDMHPRRNKYKHAAMFPLRTGVAGNVLPEAALVCNFPAGAGALLEHADVQTFFHEFGHLLHHMMAGKQRWSALGGISTEGDFVEAPSQMLEEWAYHPATLKSFARNAAGETIPDELIVALRQARDFGQGLAAAQQMFQAAVSLQLHQHDPSMLSPGAQVEALQGRYSPFAFVPNTHFELSFAHLEGYSAIYYTYMWSQVLAKDMFSEFAREGLLNPDVARRYRKCVLEPGSSKDAHDLLRDFLGRDSEFDAFAEWLDGALN